MSLLPRPLKRRLVTVPAVIVGGLLWIALIPLWLPVALVTDLFRPKAPVAARAGFCLTLYFLISWIGLGGCFVFWLGRALGLIRNTNTYLKYHYNLQHLWGSWLLTGCCRLLKLKLEWQGQEHIQEGRVLVFMRHASLLDTLIPAAAFGQKRTLNPRYLLKKELLVEPCLDICGNRIPNLFVDRSGANRPDTLQKVQELAHAMGSDDDLILYPEGTRFTEAKKQRIESKLESEGKVELLAQSRRLQRLLPVRTGGPLACFRGAPDADVLIVGHVGLEGASSWEHLWSGRVFNNVVRVRLWRIPNEQLPESPEERIQWLCKRWEELDEWTQATHAELIG